MLDRQPANHQRHPRLERMRVIPVANPHAHKTTSGATKDFIPIDTNDTDLSYPPFFLSLSRTSRLNRAADPKFINKATSILVALR